MDDRNILTEIDELVAEEHELRRAHPEGLDDTQQARLHLVENHLDQLWDLLRQRRARREFGDNPDNATERPAGEVETYLQ